jgi:hypothetical protein
MVNIRYNSLRERPFMLQTLSDAFVGSMGILQAGYCCIFLCSVNLVGDF